MTIFDPFDDFGWPLDSNHSIQKKIWNQIICIACAFRHVSDFWPRNDLFDPFDDLEMHIIRIKIKFSIDSYSYHVHLAIFSIFDPRITFFDPKMTFSTLLMTLDDLEMHIIRIRIKFPIDLYAYHVHLDIFSIFDPKMTFFDPLDDLGWPRDTNHWI